MTTKIRAIAAYSLVSVLLLSVGCSTPPAKGGRNETPTEIQGENAVPDERVEYYRWIELRYGWKPVGVGRVPEEQARREEVPYRFVYRGGELYAVFFGVGGRDQLVWGRAFVLHPDLSPYGGGAFVIGPGSDAPQYGRNFPSDLEDWRYFATLDRKGRLARYRIVYDAEERRYEAGFRCTYDDEGRLVRLDAFDNEMEVFFPFVSQQWFYDDNGYRVVELEQGREKTTAMIYDRDEDGVPTNTGIIAERLADGTYRVAGGRDAPGGWYETDQLPEEFHEFIEELPLPAGDGK